MDGTPQPAVKLNRSLVWTVDLFKNTILLIGL